MKRYFSPLNIIYFILLTVLLNSYMFVKQNPYLLIFIIPLFIILNTFSGMQPRGTKKLRLKLCNHGTLLLALFVWSLIPSAVWHIILAFFAFPTAYMDFIFSALYCTLASAFLFWNGILCGKFYLFR